MSHRMLSAVEDLEAAAMEQARSMDRELRRLADATPNRRVLAAVEAVAVERGRRFVRDRLQDMLNAQSADLEKKRVAAGTAPAAAGGATTAEPSAGWSPPPAT